MLRRQPRGSSEGMHAPATDHDPRPHLLDRIAQGLQAIALVVMGLMALHIVVDVTLTALFTSPITGTLEVVGHYYMVSIILLPLAALHLSDQHITADFFTERAAPGLLRALDVLSNLCLAGFSAVIVWQGSVLAWQRTQEHENIMVSQLFVYVWPTRWLVPLGFGLLALVALAKALQAARRPAADWQTAD